jgi:hypothetical protein
MTALRSRPAAPAAVSRAPRRRAAAAPVTQASGELAAAAQALGADVSSGPDFMEISFPPPAGVSPATVARTPARAPSGPTPAPAVAREAAGPRSLSGGSVLARSTGGSGGDLSMTESVVEAVLRAMREENEHLGIIDGIDPLF